MSVILLLVSVRQALAVLVLAGCGAHLDTQNNVAPDASGSAPDAPPVMMPDAPMMMPDAAPLGAWGTPTPVNGASDPTISQDDVTASSTLTELYFHKLNGANSYDLYVMTRATPMDPWGAPQPVPGVNTTQNEESPRLSPDDLTLYFGRSGDIYKITRTAVGSPWSAPQPVPEGDTAMVYEKWMAVCDNGYFLISRANGADGQDLYVGQLGNGPGTLAAELSSTSSEISSFLSKDCLTAYFASNRSGQTQIYTATRPDVNSPFSMPSLYDVFGTATDNEDLWVSEDQRTAFFASIRGGATLKAVYTSTR